MIQERAEVANLIKSVKLETDHLDSAEKSWLIRNKEGRLIGFACSERRGDYVYLQSVSVDRKYQKQGIGRKLINMAFDGLNKGDTLIALTLFWNNTFYRKCGFERLDAKAVKARDDIGGREKHKHCTAWGKTK